MYYAGIGSRETPERILRDMGYLANYLEDMYILRSGGAEGADKAFEGGLKSNTWKEIFYPQDDIPLWCYITVDFFHPAPERLKPFPRKIMARNAMQILGRDGDTPVDFVICWTEGGKLKGGTAQAMRIAMYYKIPIYNLYDWDVDDLLKDITK